MTGKKALKQFPKFQTDEEAERFVEEADLSEYDFSGFKPMSYEFLTKSATLSMRIPQQLVDAVKVEAAKDGVPYQRFIRQVLEEAITARQARQKKAG